MNSHSVQPITIYHGKDNYLVKKKFIRLQESLGGNPDQSFEVSHFDGKHNETTVSDIIALLQSPPLGIAENHKQIVVIWNYEKIFTEKTLPTLIAEMGDNYAFLISAATDTKKKLSDHFLKKHRPLIDYQWERFVNYQKNTTRLENFFQENQFKASNKTIHYLVQYFQKKSEQIIDAKIDLMEAELEKIMLFFPKKAMISIEKITPIIDELQEEKNEFEIMNAFFSRNPTLTLRNFLIFLKNSGDLHSLINRFVYEINQIIKFKEMTLENKNSEAIFKDLGYRFKIQQDNMKQRHSLFNFKSILTLLDDFIKIDQILKTENLNNPNTTKSRIQVKAKLAFEKVVLLRLGDNQSY